MKSNRTDAIPIEIQTNTICYLIPKMHSTNAVNGIWEYSINSRLNFYLLVFSFVFVFSVCVCVSKCLCWGDFCILFILLNPIGCAKLKTSIHIRKQKTIVFNLYKSLLLFVLCKWISFFVYFHHPMVVIDILDLNPMCFNEWKTIGLFWLKWNK